MLERVARLLRLQGSPAYAAPRLRLCSGQQGHDTRALQVYLGHKNIQHTVRYAELAPDRFKDIPSNQLT